MPTPGFGAILAGMELWPPTIRHRPESGRVIVLGVCLLLAAAGAARAQAPAQASDPFKRVFARLYNYDFAGAHVLLDEQLRSDPANPLVHAVRAAAYLFAEMGRLKILEAGFFLNDDNMVDGQGHNAKPDPAVKRQVFAAIDQTRARAQARLAVDPDDRSALFAMVMASGVGADYTGFVERREWKGMSLSRETNRYAQKLLSLKPPVYDAYLNVGALQYVTGSLPFYIRWFVHFDNIDANKRKGIESLKLVAQHGTYYGPFARILLAVVSLREGKLEDARAIMAQLSSEYPENTLMKYELRTITERIAANTARPK